MNTIILGLAIGQQAYIDLMLAQWWQSNNELLTSINLYCCGWVVLT